MSAAQRIARALDAAQARVAAARSALEADVPVDLADLERQVALACDGIAALPRQQAVAMRNALLSLISDLDALAAALTARRDTLKGGLDEGDARRRAVAAYGRAPVRR